MLLNVCAEAEFRDPPPVLAQFTNQNAYGCMFGPPLSSVVCFSFSRPAPQPNKRLNARLCLCSVFHPPPTPS